MREIRVTITSPEAADHGVAELWAVDELIGYTLLLDSDLMLASSLAMTEPGRRQPSHPPAESKDGGPTQ